MTLDPEVSKSINELIVFVLGTITTVVLPYALILFRSWAKAKIDSIQNSETRDALEFALERLDQTACTIVTELNQTREQLSADGKLSKEDATLLLKKAYSRLQNRLPADVLETLKHVYSDKIQSVMVGKIESKVAEAKGAMQCKS